MVLASKQAMEMLERWQPYGVNVYELNIDLATDATGELFNEYLQDKPPLKGIVHAATVIEDALFNTMTSDGLRAVLSPKINGAWALHNYSVEHAQLDFFVLFSSATTCFGNPGQSNYVAANAYLEAFSSYRKGLGLPALCIGWGAIDDVGFLARNHDIKKALVSRLGGSALQSSEVLGVIETAILNQSVDSSYLAINWRQMAGLLPSAKQPKFNFFNCGDLDELEDSNHLYSRLQAMPFEERLNTVVELLSRQVEKILCLGEDDLEVNESLFDPGMDSLMGVELAASIETHFSVQIPAMALAESPTIMMVSKKILGQLKLLDEGDALLDSELSSELDDLDLQVKHLARKHGDEASTKDVLDKPDDLPLNIDIGHDK